MLKSADLLSGSLLTSCPRVIWKRQESPKARHCQLPSAFRSGADSNCRPTRVAAEPNAAFASSKTVRSCHGMDSDHSAATESTQSSTWAGVNSFGGR